MIFFWHISLVVFKSNKIKVFCSFPLSQRSAHKFSELVFVVEAESTVSGVTLQVAIEIGSLFSDLCMFGGFIIQKKNDSSLHSLSV